MLRKLLPRWNSLINGPLLVLCLCGTAFGQTVSLVNLSGHGTNSQFFVGDAWEITLTGPAGAPIGVNGVDTGDTIDPNGTRQYTGTIQQGSEGSNSQAWTVGGATASPYPLQFTVEPAPENSCASVADISASPETWYITDVLHTIFTLDTTYRRNPATAKVIADLEPSLATCEVHQYGTAPGTWYVPLYASAVTITGNKVEFTIDDAGCNYGGSPRSCSWFSPWPNPPFPPSLDYPVYTQLYVWTEYYDRYYKDYAYISTYAFAWIDYEYAP